MNSRRDKLKSKVLKVLAVYFEDHDFEDEEVFSAIYDCFYPIKDLTQQQKMVGALAKVMNGNASLMGTRLGRFASAMIKVGATSEKVFEMYGPHSWYYKYYWKGHDKGQYPNEADIRNTWDHWDIPEKPNTGITQADLRNQGYTT
jgi:hypothetical protein